jgi:hypothetical protein
VFSDNYAYASSVYLYPFLIGTRSDHTAKVSPKWLKALSQVLKTHSSQDWQAFHELALKLGAKKETLNQSKAEFFSQPEK